MLKKSIFIVLLATTHFSVRPTFIQSYLCAGLAALNAALGSVSYNAYNNNLKGVDIHSLLSSAQYIVRNAAQGTLYTQESYDNKTYDQNIVRQEMRIVLLERYALLSSTIIFGTMGVFFNFWAVKYALNTFRTTNSQKNILSTELAVRKNNHV